jgi:ubiquinone/menaquinone biosynthesis C-methylase UbiE
MSEEGDKYHRDFIDPGVYKMVGDPKGKRIYDIGCGNGYMARHFAKKGAQVFASDISFELIKIAKSKSANLNIKYFNHPATEFDNYKKEEFDAVTMNMVIHYIKDLDKLFSGISSILKDKSVFVFSTNHFFRPSYPYSEWIKGKFNGKDKLFIKHTDYLTDKKVEKTSWLDSNVKMTLYVHQLNQLVNKMSENNLFTTKIEEIDTGDMGQKYSKELQQSHHIPTFMIIGARKIS